MNIIDGKHFHLTETEKYEIWKKNFRKEMTNFLGEIFAHLNIGCYVSIQKVDKWNIEFNVSSGMATLGWLDKRLQADPTLMNILNGKGPIELIGDKSKKCFNIKANTREELDAQLGYLKIALN